MIDQWIFIDECFLMNGFLLMNYENELTNEPMD